MNPFLNASVFAVPNKLAHIRMFPFSDLTSLNSVFE